MEISAKTIIIRSIAFCLAFVGVILIFGEEKDADIPQFLLHFLLDKTIGVGLIFCAVRLLGMPFLSSKSNNYPPKSNQ